MNTEISPAKSTDLNKTRGAFFFLTVVFVLDLYCFMYLTNFNSKYFLY